MLQPIEVYLFTDQPATCPKCGARTEIIMEFTKVRAQTQYHKCMHIGCGFEFVMENDDDG